MPIKPDIEHLEVSKTTVNERMINVASHLASEDVSEDSLVDLSTNCPVVRDLQFRHFVARQRESYLFTSY